jgi:site-specific recombinase XerD
METLAMDQMPNRETTTVIVFVRHADDCRYKADRYSRRCNCRKHLYIYEAGKATFKSAKTRSWEAAEKLAKYERDIRDHVNIKLRKIAEQEAASKAAKAAKKASAITVAAALDRWLASQKGLAEGSFKAYQSFTQKVKRWALRTGIESINEVTAAMLDEWRGEWSQEATLRDNCMGPTSQSTFQGRLQRFFEWAVGIDLIESDPAARLTYIKPSDKRTNPLTPPQFEELLAAVEPFTTAQVGECREFAAELRALFLLQRWSGLRILDCLMLPRSGLVGNRLKLRTQKNGAAVNRILPDHVVTALQALAPNRPAFRAGYFLWSARCQRDNLTPKWDEYIQKMNSYLTFLDEEGLPMPFRSHMLRDTYAVEMLLAGVSLEDVSRLLTHKSIRTTEQYYAHWVQARREQLEDKSVAAMRRMGVTIGGE